MTGIARRPFLAAGLAGFALAAMGVLVYEAPALLHPRYPRSPYDDLLDRLSNRDDAVRLGSAVIAVEKDFNPHNAARTLRARLASASLGAVADADLRAGHLIEIHGWVLPDSLAALCALAASVSLPHSTRAHTMPASSVKTSGI